MEINLVTSDGSGISPLEVTELGAGLYRVENGGGFIADQIDFGDTVLLESLGHGEYLLKERTESTHRRFDLLIPRSVDLDRPDIQAYLGQVLYWEVNYGGWLCVFTEADSPLQPDEDLEVLCGGGLQAEAGGEEAPDVRTLQSRSLETGK